MAHSLYSWNQERPIQFFDKFNADEIKDAIVKHLREDKADTLEHCKEFNKSDARKYYGNEILNIYKCNKNGDPCRIVTKGTKEYLSKLN